VTAPLDAGLEVCRSRLAAEGPLAVAFSGGGDSLGVLLVARAWARRHGRPILALHVDHGLQAQSAAWSTRAAAMAERLGTPFRRLVWEGAKPASGLPAAARSARHRLIADAARAFGARVVLLGHTLDDQLENALMRGAGVPVGALRDWSASPVWPQGRGLFHCRPLLAVRRAALREWLTGKGLDWIEDPANGDPRYARSRARQTLHEGAEAEPMVPPADIRALAQACEVTPWGAVQIDRQALRAAPGPQAARLLQIAVACASGVEHLARPARARGLLERLRGADAFTASLAGCRVVAASSVRLVREAGEAARGGLRPVALGPDAPVVWDGRWEGCGPAGSNVLPLSGLAASLDHQDEALLRMVPASDRPSLPVFMDADGRVRLASLALQGLGAHKCRDNRWFAPLIEPRLKAACGLIQREDEIGTNARMAKLHPPSYVGAEGKG
jgi:tRNA(Ile)-lysidine synthase